VKESCDAFEYVPEKLKTSIVCLEAVRRNGLAINYVPGKIKTQELYFEAVKQNAKALFYVPNELRTIEFWLKAIKMNGWVLKYIPHTLKTLEMCIEAVKDVCRRLDGEELDKLIEYVPKKFKAQVKQSNIMSVPEKIINIFCGIPRIEEQWSIDDQSDNTYQVKFTLDGKGSWFTVWIIDEYKNFYRYEGHLVTSSGNHKIKEGTFKLTTQQIRQALFCASTDEIYAKILAYKNRICTVSKDVNFKTGEGMKCGPWNSWEEMEQYMDALNAEDYDNEL
jgi:hypothetical protein